MAVPMLANFGMIDTWRQMHVNEKYTSFFFFSLLEMNIISTMYTW